MPLIEVEGLGLGVFSSFYEILLKSSLYLSGRND